MVKYMKLKQILVITALVSSAYSLNAQIARTSPVSLIPLNNKVLDEEEPARNFIKLNLTSLVFKNYSLQYERVLNKTVSLAASFRTMPKTSIPFKSTILKQVGEDDPDTEEILESLRLNNVAFTPEVRFYVGKKGYGRGFYIAPFYRYAKFNINKFVVDYQSVANVEGNVNLSGDFSAHTGGILFGAQWALGRRLCLDWWILGPHYGGGSGTFAGITNKPLTQDEQNDVRRQLEDIDIPFTDKTVNVNANGASLTLDGPWAGIRAGISFGIRF
jgi:hypothetical protein